MVNFSIIRDISGNTLHPLHASLSTEGFFWFTNLAATDPMFILPLISAAITYLNIHELLRRSALQEGGGPNPL